MAPGVPHHVTQRGNRRQQTFFCEEDYRAYLHLMAEWCSRWKVIDGAMVHPREVFKVACLHNAASIILFHNHPSGDLYPSLEDKNITKRLSDAGEKWEAAG